MREFITTTQQRQRNGNDLLREIIETAATQAYQIGVRDGTVAGWILGYEEGIKTLMPAVSDGLRHRSPECARVMRSRRNSGAGNESSAT